MNEELTDLGIDLGDPQTIKEKLPQVEEIVAEKREVAARIQHDLETWTKLLSGLRSLAGVVIHVDEVGGVTSGRPSPAQDAVVRVVEQENRPMRPIEVAERLVAEGHQVASNNAVNSALYAAADAGRLHRPGARLYAPRQPDNPDAGEA